MKYLHRIFRLGHLIISLLFIVCAISLIALAVAELFRGLWPSQLEKDASRLNSILEALALLTVAVAALELGQTIAEEEVQREAHMSAPTRVRRFLSRFLVVLVVALSIETVVIVFRAGRDNNEQMVSAAYVGFTAAALLASWGVFVRLNRSAEELEPEAMEHAKREDVKVERREEQES
jgi:ABC-type transport system involved in cytochrome bd biosynthesis fused ATPase/permease subunit